MRITNNTNNTNNNIIRNFITHINDVFRIKNKRILKIEIIFCLYIYNFKRFLRVLRITNT